MPKPTIHHWLKHVRVFILRSRSACPVAELIASGAAAVVFAFIPVALIQLMLCFYFGIGVERERGERGLRREWAGGGVLWSAGLMCIGGIRF